MSGRVGLACALAALAAGSPAFGQSDSYEASSGLIPLGGLIVFFNAGGPLSYATLTPKDLPAGAVPVGPVKGRSCQFGVSTPVVGVSGPRLSAGAGQGGFEQALEDIRTRHPDLAGIYDVKVDDHVIGVLTVFQRQCTEVTASGFR